MTRARPNDVLADLLRENAELRAEVERLNEDREKYFLDNLRLREALQNLMNDVLEYERINNLAPSPGKQDCWQSVTDARRALENKP